MKTYQYQSKIFDTEVQVTYNGTGLIVGFQVLNGQDVRSINLESGQLKNYAHESAFLEATKKANTRLTVVDKEVSFDMFWNRYAQKDCGRKKAQQAWDKLSKADQVRAYEFIPIFEGILKNNNTPKPYATTYLNQARWIR